MASTWSCVTYRTVPLVRRWELDELRAHLHAQRGVQVGQRFVHEVRGRLPDHGAAERDPLALAAGELPGALLELVGEPEGLAGVGDPLLDDVLRHAVGA